MPRNKYPEQTVEKILSAAERLFAQKGYAKTTLQDIIDTTGLSKGAVYHHFKSKEEIAAKVGDRLGARVAAELAGRQAAVHLCQAHGLAQLLQRRHGARLCAQLLHLRAHAAQLQAGGNGHHGQRQATQDEKLVRQAQMVKQSHGSRYL